MKIILSDTVLQGMNNETRAANNHGQIHVT
jgi:hypothetical protein